MSAQGTTLWSEEGNGEMTCLLRRHRGMSEEYKVGECERGCEV
jgi:hypothetical protein